MPNLMLPPIAIFASLYPVTCIALPGWEFPSIHDELGETINTCFCRSMTLEGLADFGNRATMTTIIFTTIYELNVKCNIPPGTQHLKQCFSFCILQIVEHVQEERERAIDFGVLSGT